MKKIRVNQRVLSADWLDAIMHDGAIEGKARLILKNEKTGKEKIIEHKNLVTNAVRNIFLYDYDRNQNLPDLIPLKKLFGGVLLFEDAFENPTVNDILVPSDSHNKMTGCAGDEAHATLNPYRGNPNAIASSISANGRVMTQVWEWQTSQGNGKIGSICLTSATGGNMGTKPFDDSYSPINANSNNSDSGFFYPANISWDDVAKQRCPLRIDGTNGQYGYTLSFDKTTGILTETKIEHPFLATSLISAANEFIVRETRTLNLSSLVLPLTHFYIGYENGFYYFIGHNYDANPDDSHDDITWVKIDVTDMTVDSSGSYVDLHALLYDIYQTNIYSWSRAQTAAINRALPIIDGYAYLPTRGPFDDPMIEPTLIKIPLKSGESISIVDSADGESTLGLFNLSNYPTIGQDVDSLAAYPVKVGKGIIAGYGYLLNDGVLYKTANPKRPKGTVTTTGAISQIPHGFFANRDETFPSFHQSLWSNYSARTTNNGFAYSNLYLATINNLDEQVTKTPIMSMRVEYTLSVLS